MRAFLVPPILVVDGPIYDTICGTIGGAVVQEHGQQNTNNTFINMAGTCIDMKAIWETHRHEVEFRWINAPLPPLRNEDE